MKLGFFSRLFPQPKPLRPSASASAPTPPAATVAVAPADLPWRAPLDVDRAFYRWIFGVPQDCDAALSREEERLLARVEQVIAGDDSKFVPRMPHIIPQMLKILNGQHHSIAQLARQLNGDPVLVACVIRQANSSAHHHGIPISSIDRALAVIGEQELRQILSLAAFRPIIDLQSGKYTKTAAPTIWEQTKYCAALCHSLDRSNAGDPFQSYLAGMLPCIGLISVLRILDRSETPLSKPPSTDFSNRAGRQARALSARIARTWDLPAIVIEAVQSQLPAAEGIAATGLARALFVGDQLSKMRVMINAQYLPDSYDSIAEGLDPETAKQYHECAFISF